MKAAFLVVGLLSAVLGTSAAMAAVPAAGAAPTATTGSSPPGAGAASVSAKSLMTLDERNAHGQKLRSFTSVEDCKAYVADVEKKMIVRAKEKGLDTSQGLRGESCAKAATRGKK
ncbi:MAG: hypothetical protein GZ089_14675 [Aromatoleum sp.]|nr:hypothetical protein [Aromatoleum sp.]